MSTINYNEQSTPEFNLTNVIREQNAEGLLNGKFNGAQPFPVLASKAILNEAARQDANVAEIEAQLVEKADLVGGRLDTRQSPSGGTQALKGSRSKDPIYAVTGSSLAGWTLTEGGGTATLTDGVLTLADSGAGITKARAPTLCLFSGDEWVWDMVIQSAGNRASAVLSATAPDTAVLWLAFYEDGTVANFTTGSPVFLPAPPNFDPTAKFRVRIGYSATSRTASAAMIYESTVTSPNNDENQVHHHLGVFDIASLPRQFWYQTGDAGSGTVTISEIEFREVGLIAIGDSITAGRDATAGNPEWNPVPDYDDPPYSLEATWPYWFREYTGVGCENWGVSSLTMQAALLRLAPWVNMPAEGVVLWLGTNDIRDGRTLAQMQADFTALLAAFAPRTIIVVEVLPRNTFTTSQKNQIEDWNAYLEANETALGYRLIRTYDEFLAPESAGDRFLTLSTDGVHPYVAGKRRIARLLVDQL